MDRGTGTAKNGANASWIVFAIGSRLSCFRRNIAEQIGLTNPVVLVEPSISAIRHPLNVLFRGRSESSSRSQITHYWPLHIPERIPCLRKRLNHLNQLHLQSEMERLLKGAPTVVCYDSPTQYGLVGAFHEKLSVYLSIDDRTVTVSGEPIPGELEAERKLLAKVHLVVCVSEPLAETLRQRSPSPEKPPIHVLTNGYEEWLFDPRRLWPEPEQLRRVSKPRILVAGHVSERIDWGGVESAVSLRPEWTWIFIGPADPGVPEKINSRLGKRACYCAATNIQEIPAWIQHSDACAVPYRLNNFTRASSPLKAIEYLAMGKPVLSTQVPSLLQYRHVIEWVEETSGESYANALDACLERSGDPDGALRRSMAVSNDSWNRRTIQFSELVLSYVNPPSTNIAVTERSANA